MEEQMKNLLSLELNSLQEQNKSKRDGDLKPFCNDPLYIFLSMPIVQKRIAFSAKWPVPSPRSRG